MSKDKGDRKKKLEESSDTDSSGPTDRTPVAKKPKSDNSTSSKVNNEEPSWELGNKKFVKVNTFKGQVYVNIREFYDDGGTLKPGKKGISLSAAQWQKLRGIIEEVNEAVQNT